jgi:hypothetical protein
MQAIDTKLTVYTLESEVNEDLHEDLLVALEEFDVVAALRQHLQDTVGDNLVKKIKIYLDDEEVK